MTPFYFRSAAKALFGIYHPPAGRRPRDCGVVICHPIGHEYTNGYRALRQLSLQLSRAGFGVLRFDYYGCGDSSGDALESDLAQWKNDVLSAIEEIRSRNAPSKLCLIGARIGATLSLQVAGERSEIQGLVLWDPVVKGKPYLDDLLAQHREWLDARPPGIPAGEPIMQALGFPINPGLKEDLEAVNLMDVSIVPPRRILTIESDKTEDGLQLSERLERRGADSEYRYVPVPRVWRRQDGGDNVVVPAPTLQAIVEWISRMAS